MKFYWISGSWRTINDEVKHDVQNVVQEIVKAWDGIVTGGALGVDFIATQIVLAFGDPTTQLKIHLPISLEKFCQHYHNKANEWVITKLQAAEITSQLHEVFTRAPESILDTTPFTAANEESYYARNTTIIETCDELYAFQVNNSQWVQDAIDKTKALGKPVTVKKYTIDKE